MKIIFFKGVCTSTRECISEQICINGVCHPTCQNNNTCPDLQYCENGICAQEIRCHSNNDCDFSKQCTENSFGQVSVCYNFI